MKTLTPKKYNKCNEFENMDLDYDLKNWHDAKYDCCRIRWVSSRQLQGDNKKITSSKKSLKCFIFNKNKMYQQITIKLFRLQHPEL